MDYLTTDLVAGELGITPEGVLALIRREKLYAEKLGRDYVIQRAELERYKKDRLPRGRPRKPQAENPAGEKKTRGRRRKEK